MRVVCAGCTHPPHRARCGAPVVETVRDDVGIFAKPTGVRRDMITETCECTVQSEVLELLGIARKSLALAYQQMGDRDPALDLMKSMLAECDSAISMVSRNGHNDRVGYFIRDGVTFGPLDTERDTDAR